MLRVNSMKMESRSRTVWVFCKVQTMVGRMVGFLCYPQGFQTRVMGKKGDMSRPSTLLRWQDYGWIGQRKSAAAFRVTVTIPALCADRTACSEVSSVGVTSELKVTVKTLQAPP